ncbi:uracil-DNA glycosylase [Myxococcota bacterium]|nr:uracil-DNA glycosylase [Myxococcota bacterium]MBU1430607.1 uracil-DNA glycosylase [Myxococcota bacterium]MBU1896399.1 uracil-DNA glycosylase [Myxococcota bacterium]
MPEREVQIHPSWLAVVGEEFDKPYMTQLRAFLEQEQAQHQVFPPNKEIFSAFEHTPFDEVRVVILGQDPYHGPGQANGLCFSVKRGVKVPPSLVNIFKEIESEMGYPRPKHGDLTSWAQQGVLLLNAVLTVRARNANSHRDQGWETFTDQVIRALSAQKEGLIFLLWGGPAKKKARMIDANKHLILTASHPSPLSAHNGWFGCGHFAQVNEHLKARGDSPINWRLPE